MLSLLKLARLVHNVNCPGTGVPESSFNSRLILRAVENFGLELVLKAALSEVRSVNL